MSVGAGVPEGEIMASFVVVLLIELGCKGETVVDVVGAKGTIESDAEACGPRVVECGGWGKEVDRTEACLVCAG